jgi:hypothetical protein
LSTSSTIGLNARDPMTIGPVVDVDAGAGACAATADHAAASAMQQIAGRVTPMAGCRIS